MTRESMDELDLLYNRLEPADLPPGFVASVMAKVAEVDMPARSPLRPFWLVVDALAALVLTWAAFSVGRVLALGAFDQGSAGLLFDLDLALAAPTAWLIAVGELVPLVAMASLVGAGLVVAFATHAILAGAVRRPRVA